MAVHRIKQDGKVKYVDDSAGNAHISPKYSCEVGPPDSEGCREVHHWMAFNPEYGPESQAQIDWHLNRGTPGAEKWEVGKSL